MIHENAMAAVDARLGLQVRSLRHQLGLSEEELAEAIGVSVRELRGYETGARPIQAASLWRLSQVLQSSIDALLGDEDVTVDTGEAQPATASRRYH